MFKVANLDCTKSICEADVVLAKPLIYDVRPIVPDANVFNLSLEVRDTKGERTIVQSQIRATQPTTAFVK